MLSLKTVDFCDANLCGYIRVICLPSVTLLLEVLAFNLHLGQLKKKIHIHRLFLESTPFYFSALAGIISGPGTICGPIWGSFTVPGSFAVRDHVRACTALKLL